MSLCGLFALNKTKQKTKKLKMKINKNWLTRIHAPHRVSHIYSETISSAPAYQYPLREYWQSIINIFFVFATTKQLAININKFNGKSLSSESENESESKNLSGQNSHKFDFHFDNIRVFRFNLYLVNKSFIVRVSENREIGMHSIYSINRF